MESKIKKLQQLNPNFEIFNITSSEFKKYGEVLDLKCSKKLISKLENDSEIPNSGNIYKPFIRDWEEKDIIDELSPFYNGKIELGYCNGHNTKLNALEWHDCNEINIYSTDALLFLAKLEDLDDYNLESNKIKAFYLEKGTAIVMYKDTLHFSPCAVEDSGFKSVIVLDDLTNIELENEEIIKRNNASKKIDKLLFKNNKYIICHKEADHLTKQGVNPYIKGENYNLIF